MKRNHFIMSKR